MKKKLPQKIKGLRKDELQNIKGGRRPYQETPARRLVIRWDDVVLRKPRVNDPGFGARARKK